MIVCTVHLAKGIKRSNKNNTQKEKQMSERAGMGREWKKNGQNWIFKLIYESYAYETLYR